jgi:hypothetical protein
MPLNERDYYWTYRHPPDCTCEYCEKRRSLSSSSRGKVSREGKPISEDDEFLEHFYHQRKLNLGDVPKSQQPEKKIQPTRQVYPLTKRIW